MTSSRARTFGVAVVLAFGLLVSTRQLGCHGAYSAHGAYRAQVDALLDGRLALSTVPEGLAHDLAWSEGGVHQVWGLGVPLWQLPFEAAARLVGADPFPDRVAMGLWLALAFFIVLRALRSRDDEPWWLGAGAVLVTLLLPGFLAMIRGRVGVYEEAATYAYTAALVLFAGVIVLARTPRAGRYLLLVAAAGLTGLIRPTVWFYGAATLVVASAIYARAHGRAALRIIALGVALFVAGGAVLYATNHMRFGSGAEFGHRLNLHSLPGNVVATRFSYPFEDAGLVEASIELVGGLFGRPERGDKRASRFYSPELHVGQSDRVRWREYYFTTYSWLYVPLLLVGLIVGALGWTRRLRATHAGDPARWIAMWAVLGALPLAVFYLHSPSVSSRYHLDLAPAFAALLVITWRTAATWAGKHRRGAIAAGVLVMLWGTACWTTKLRKRLDIDPTDATMAAAATARLTRPKAEPRMMPSSFEAGDREWIAVVNHERPHGLYLNAFGWDLGTGRVPPAIHAFVEDPAYLELELEHIAGAPVDWRASVRAVIGLQRLSASEVVPTPRGARIRFAIPTPVRGIEVAFVAFGPDAALDRAQSDFILRRIRWRD